MTNKMLKIILLTVHVSESASPVGVLQGSMSEDSNNVLPSGKEATTQPPTTIDTAQLVEELCDNYFNQFRLTENIMKCLTVPNVDDRRNDDNDLLACWVNTSGSRLCSDSGLLCLQRAQIKMQKCDDTLEDQKPPIVKCVRSVSAEDSKEEWSCPNQDDGSDNSIKNACERAAPLAQQCDEDTSDTVEGENKNLTDCVCVSKSNMRIELKKKVESIIQKIKSEQMIQKIKMIPSITPVPSLTTAPREVWATLETTTREYRPKKILQEARGIDPLQNAGPYLRGVAPRRAPRVAAYMCKQTHHQGRDEVCTCQQRLANENDYTSVDEEICVEDEACLPIRLDDRYCDRKTLRTVYNCWIQRCINPCWKALTIYDYEKDDLIEESDSFPTVSACQKKCQVTAKCEFFQFEIRRVDKSEPDFNLDENDDLENHPPVYNDMREFKKCILLKKVKDTRPYIENNVKLPGESWTGPGKCFHEKLLSSWWKDYLWYTLTLIFIITVAGLSFVHLTMIRRHNYRERVGNFPRRRNKWKERLLQKWKRQEEKTSRKSHQSESSASTTETERERISEMIHDVCVPPESTPTAVKINVSATTTELLSPLTLSLPPQGSDVVSFGNGGSNAFHTPTLNSSIGSTQRRNRTPSGATDVDQQPES